MKKLFIQLIGVLLILAMFNSCITVAPDNRSQAVLELNRLGIVSILRVPMEDAIGPAYNIESISAHTRLMTVGQLGLDLGYRYFVILEGSLTTHEITVVYTNDESHDGRFNTAASASSWDGLTFTTQAGRVWSWALYSTVLVGGLIMSSVGMSVANTRDRDRGIALAFSGLGLSLGSALFLIPVFRQWPPEVSSGLFHE